jgi:lysozyme
MKLSYTLSVVDDPISIAERIAKPFENCKLQSYWDVAGFPTNGWGNLLSRVTKKQVMERFELTPIQADEWLAQTWPPITQDQADLDFEKNIRKAFNGVAKSVKVQLGNNQLGALTDFAYNLGVGNLQASTLLRMINRGELIMAADEFMKWDKAGGIKYRGLARRRSAERQVYLEGLQ